jgi:hypothetical protein
VHYSIFCLNFYEGNSLADGPPSTGRPAYFQISVHGTQGRSNDERRLANDVKNLGLFFHPAAIYGRWFTFFRKATQTFAHQTRFASKCFSFLKKENRAIMSKRFATSKTKHDYLFIWPKQHQCANREGSLLVRGSAESKPQRQQQQVKVVHPITLLQELMQISCGSVRAC